MTRHCLREALHHSPVMRGDADRSPVFAREAVVLGPTSDGVLVEVVPGLQGHVPTAELDITHYPDLAGFKPGHMISVKVLEVGFHIL